VYVSRLGDDGKTTVEFGDGHEGARLPTGLDNVRATYKKGLGLEGLVEAGQLSLLPARPLGVVGVTNPLPSEGAEDPETLDGARDNAPGTVLTLDRAVSLRDYEDFALGFAGIDKALATWVWDGRTRRVVITVAGPAGAPIPAGGATHTALVQALGAAGDPRVAFGVVSFRPTHFRAALRVKVHPDHAAAVVLPAVEAALRAHFAFGRRRFGQPVALSEVIAAAHAVTGVVAIDVDRLFRTTPPGATPIVHPRLPAAMPRLDPGPVLLGAELLSLDPGPLAGLEEMA
jgi:predicted phage baseplate assembly protein